MSHLEAIQLRSGRSLWVLRFRPSPQPALPDVGRRHDDGRRPEVQLQKMVQDVVNIGESLQGGGVRGAEARGAAQHPVGGNDFSSCRFPCFFVCVEHLCGTGTGHVFGIFLWGAIFGKGRR